MHNITRSTSNKILMILSQHLRILQTNTIAFLCFQINNAQKLSTSFYCINTEGAKILVYILHTFSTPTDLPNDSVFISMMHTSLAHIII